MGKTQESGDPDQPDGVKSGTFFKNRPENNGMVTVLRCILSPLRFRLVFRQFLRREVLARYRGSILGITWALLTPLMMLGVYTLVFVGVFKARWPGAEEAGGLAFALNIFAGLMVFNLFSEVIGRSPNLIIEQPNLVKKVSFPLELLAYLTMGSALFHFFLSTLILIFGLAVLTHSLPPTLLFIPIVILPLLPLLLGLSWTLSALGVYIRDISAIIGMALSLFMFLSPIFFSPSALSPRWQTWINLNPLTAVIENLRRVAFLGVMPDWSSWSIALVLFTPIAFAGAWVFGKTRDGFGDVL